MVRALIVAGLLALVLSRAALAGANSYNLLEIDDWIVKWGREQLGAGAVVTYSFARTRENFPGARNCKTIEPLDRLLKATGFQEQSVRRQARAAFEAWSNVADIRFREVVPGERPDILIGSQGKPRGRAFANVSLPPHRLAARQEGRQLNAVVKKLLPRIRRRSPVGVSRIARALICLNPKHQWKLKQTGDPKAYDLRYTLTHEIGHAIGLDHTGARGQLMSFIYQEDLSGLQPGDISGARRLYGRAKRY